MNMIYAHWWDVSIVRWMCNWPIGHITMEFRTTMRENRHAKPFVSVSLIFDFFFNFFSSVSLLYCVLIVRCRCSADCRLLLRLFSSNFFFYVPFSADKETCGNKLIHARSGLATAEAAKFKVTCIRVSAYICVLWYYFFYALLARTTPNILYGIRITRLVHIIMVCGERNIIILKSSSFVWLGKVRARHATVVREQQQVHECIIAHTHTV